MSIYIDGSTRVIVQGMTGRQGLFHSEQMMRCGTKIAAGVTPGKGADPVAVYNAYVAMPEGAEKEAYLAANAKAIEEGYAKSKGK